MVLGDMHKFYVKSEGAMTPSIAMEKCCEKCYCKLLGVGWKRYAKYKRNFIGSDYSLRVWESKHKDNIRPSFKTDYFEAYLLDLQVQL